MDNVVSIKMQNLILMARQQQKEFIVINKLVITIALNVQRIIALIQLLLFKKKKFFFLLSPMLKEAL